MEKEDPSLKMKKDPSLTMKKEDPSYFPMPSYITETSKRKRSEKNSQRIYSWYKLNVIFIVVLLANVIGELSKKPSAERKNNWQRSKSPPMR